MISTGDILKTINGQIKKILALLTIVFFCNTVSWAAENNLSWMSLLLGNKILATSTVKDDVIIIDAQAIADIVEVIIDDAGATLLQLSGDLENSVQNGSLLFILPGTDEQFPLGLAGRVVEIIYNVNGTKTVKLEQVSYAEIIKESSFDLSDIPLDASNFIGVIAPSGVQASPGARRVAKSVANGEDVYSFRNGAIVVGSVDKKSKLLKGIDIDGTMSAGAVSLNIKVDLSNMGTGIKASTMMPLDADTSVGFVITGALDNIKLTKKIDFDLKRLLIGHHPLESMELRVDGDLNFDVKFNGNGTVKFGPFSQAWNEVESETFKVLGVSGKLLGLSPDDKIGKYPVAGLVWSVELCPSTCPVVAGVTQTHLIQAKKMGVILWVYLTLEGEYSLEGDLSLVRLNLAELSLGMKKSSEDDLKLISSLERKFNTNRLLEAPHLNGSFDAELKAGFTLDVDFFASGIRIGNTGMDLGAITQMELLGDLSYGTDSLSSPWSWEGDACFTSNIGAGAVVRASARVGVEIETAWDAVSGSFQYQYAIQIPTDKEMDSPGWHSTWYTVSGMDICTAPPLPPTLSQPINLSELDASDGNLFSWKDEANPADTKYCLIINYRDSGLSDFNTCDGIGTAIDWFKDLEYLLPPGSLDPLTEYTWSVFTMNETGSFNTVPPVWWNFTTAPVTYTCSDSDKDGFFLEGGCGTEIDCNDEDSEMAPTLSEVCGDGKDNNCDGQIDEDCGSTCTDGDGDSFFLEAGCGTEIDCNDQDSEISPSFSEVCDDGKDNNCDGQIDEGCGSTCTDSDDDGYFVELGCGTAIDCNDQDSEMSPDLSEVCGDGKDNNCDGQIDEGCNNIPTEKIAISASPDPVRSTEQLYYALTVSNPTGSILTNVILEALLPDYTRIYEAETTGDGDCVGTSLSHCTTGNAVRWQLGNLAPGEVRTVQMSPDLVYGPPPDGTVLRLGATVSYSGGTATAVRYIIVNSNPSVSLSFVEDRDQVGAGDTFSYSLRMHNRSVLNMYNGEMSATIPDGAVFVSATDGGALNGNKVSWTLGTVGAAGEVERRFTVQVLEGAVNGTLLTAESVVSGEVDGVPVTSTGSTVTAVQSTPPLLLNISASPDPVRSTEHLYYALTVSNPTGSILTNVILEALLPDYTRIYEAETTGDGDCVGTSLSHCTTGNAVRWQLGNLAPGEVRTVQMSPDLVYGPPPDGTVLRLEATVSYSGGTATAVNDVFVGNI